MVKEQPRAAEWLKSLTRPESEMHLPERAAEHLADLIDEVEFYNAKIDRATDRLDRIVSENAGAQLLMTIPGIGPAGLARFFTFCPWYTRNVFAAKSASGKERSRAAEAVLAYADDIGRFARSKQFASYFGVTPKLDESGSTRKMGHISRRGPSVVRWLIVESAWRTITYSKAMRAFWLRVMKGQRGRKKIAIVAVARKTLTIMRAMLRDGTAWDERLAGFARSSPSCKAASDNVSEVTRSKSKRGGEAAAPAPCLR